MSAESDVLNNLVDGGVLRNVRCPHCKETNTEIASYTSSDGYNVVFRCNGICNGRPFAPTSDPLALAALTAERPYGNMLIDAIADTWNSNPSNPT